MQFLPVDELLLLVSSGRVLELVTLTADGERVHQSLRVNLCDLPDAVLHRHSFRLVQQCDHLTDPANQHPAGD